MQKVVYADRPTSEGMKNALLRAQQLLKLRWTPVGAYPVIYPAAVIGGPTLKGFFKEYRPQTGAGYSAVGYTNEKYVGVNVSIHTYMTAMANPKSALYTQNLHGRQRLSAAFYGTVCSEFASYVLGLPFHIDCPQFSLMEDMEHIDPAKLENLQLCDLLNQPKTHTAVITGIDRDESGKVVSITVTESTLPKVTETVFLPEEFTRYWLDNSYEVLRYKKLHTVTYTPDPWVHLEGDPELPAPVPNPVILPDFGDQANYRLGEPIRLSVFYETYNKILIWHHAETFTLQVEDGDAFFTPQKTGYYKAYAVSPAGESQAAEFCVTEATAATDKQNYQVGESIRLSFTCAAGDELTGFMVKTENAAKYWGYMAENGNLPDSITLPEGVYYIIAHYRNHYGVYSATPTPVFRVSAK